MIFNVLSVLVMVMASAGKVMASAVRSWRQRLGHGVSRKVMASAVNSVVDE